MANIFFSYAHPDSAYVTELARELEAVGHTIFHAGTLEAGAEWRKEIEKSLSEADAVILILSQASAVSQWVSHEAGVALGYARERGRPVILPLLIAEVPLPGPLHDVQALLAVGRPISEVAALIRRALDVQLGRLRAKEEKRREVQKRVEETAADYIRKSIQQLRERESRYQKLAYIWYGLAYVALMAGVAFGIWRAVLVTQHSGSWQAVVELIAVGIIVIGLLVALSKFSFLLGKSFMLEALRNADRCHAISFGEFYLNAFGDKAQWSEVKEALQHWNFDKGSSFSGLDAKDYDPKTLELIIDLVKTAAESKAKKEK